MLQHQLQNIMQEEIQKILRYQKQRYFAGADKAGKLMATLIKREKNKAYVTGLIDEGKKIYDHNGIKEAFVNYFRKFYKSKQIELTKIQEYLNKFKVKTITEEIKVELNKGISVEEILKMIKSLKLNKSLGLVDLQLSSIKSLKKN